MVAHFSPQLFDFLEDLAEHNEKEWFQANKSRYVEHVQEPALAFIADAGPRLKTVSPHFRADAKVQGGSLFRIHRDTRFSKDKSPYKTNTGVQFRHERGKDAHAPGFYLHIQPGESFMGVGLWRPATAVAYQIREHMDEHRKQWTAAVHRGDFAKTFALGGESLTRPPKGYDPAHPLIEDLRRKDFIASVMLTEEEVTSDDFLDQFIRLCRQAGPFMAFLCAAVDVEF